MMHRGHLKKFDMNKNQLIKLHQELVIKRMHLDRFFSDFLTYNDLDDDDTDTYQWKMYKNKLKEYNDIAYQIKATEYKIKNTR